MANRFDVKIPVTRDPNQGEVAVVHVHELGEADYEKEVTAAVLPVVLDFYAADSKPCEVLAPRYAAVAEKFAGKVRFLKAQSKANPALAARLGVTSAPTLVFFKNGQELGERLSGDEILRTALKARVEALLA
jgi:thioredoxin-like negative regulator of GroEL